MEAAAPPPPPAPPHRRHRRRLPGPFRRRVPGAPVALEDLRQVAAGDPALHHHLPAADRRGRDEFIAFFAILFTKKWPRGMFDFTVQIERWTANVSAYRRAPAARRVPAVLRGVRAVPAHPRGRVRREPFALDDLRQVAARDSAPDRARVPLLAAVRRGLDRLLRDPLHRPVPRGLFDFVVGVLRWWMRVNAYAQLADDGPLSAVQPEVGARTRVRASGGRSLSSATRPWQSLRQAIPDDGGPDARCRRRSRR